MKSSHPTIHIAPSDFCIARIEKNTMLVKIISTDNQMVSAITVKDMPYINPKDIEFDSVYIVANLGPRPPLGTVFGVSVEPFLKSFDNDFWGRIHYFHRLSKIQRSNLAKGLNKVQAKMAKLKPQFIPLDLEIRAPKGMYAGHFQVKTIRDGENEDTLNILTLKPKEEWNVADYDYFLCHECAHGIWAHMLTNRVKARWIRAYWETVKLTSASDKDIRILLKKLTKSGLTISEFYKELEEDDIPLYDACLAYIKDYHSLTIKELNILISAGDGVGDMWPKSNLELFDQEALITEYSMKNVDEFFAEAMAFHFTKKLLPKKIRSMVDKTLATLKKA